MEKSKTVTAILQHHKYKAIVVIMAFVAITVVLCFLFLCVVNVPMTRQGGVNFGQLKDTIAASFKCYDHPGMVVSIVQDGKTVFSEAFGKIQPDSNVKVTPDTKFMIASLTKSFTAALMVNVLRNNSRGKSYSLSAPLTSFVGNNLSFADEERTRYASAEDVLSHRIGLSDYQFIRFNPAFKTKDFIKFAKYWKSDRTFRGEAHYSSSAFILAAAITEVLGGKRWEDLLTERLLAPLGLDSTTFSRVANFSADDVAKPFNIRGGREAPIWPVFSRVWNTPCGSGCILSTSNDMAKWMNFILSGGQDASGRQVMPEADVLTLTKIRTYLKSVTRDLIAKPVFPETSVADEYALGWRHGYYRGYKDISHTGSTPGYASMIMMFPDKKIGIFVAMNGDDDYSLYRLPLVHYIADVMLGYTPWLNVSTMCSFPFPWSKPTAPIAGLFDVGIQPQLPYISYIGAYTSSLYGDAFVNYNSSTKSLQGFFGMGSWQLFPQRKPNNFYGRGMWATDFWDIADWEFQTSAIDRKNVTSLIIRGMYPHDPPVFQKQFS